MEEKCGQPTDEKIDPKSFIDFMKNLCADGIKGNLTKEGTDFIENLTKQKDETRQINIQKVAEKCAREVEEKIESFDVNSFMNKLFGEEVKSTNSEEPENVEENTKQKTENKSFTECMKNLCDIGLEFNITKDNTDFLSKLEKEGFKTFDLKNFMEKHLGTESKQTNYDKKMQEPVINVNVEKETSQSPFMNENHRLLSTYSQIEEDKMKLENYIKNLDDDARNAFWRSYHGINSTDVQLSIIDRKLDVFNDCMEELLTEIQILRKEVRDNKCKCSGSIEHKDNKSVTCNSRGSNDSNFSDNLDHGCEDC